MKNIPPILAFLAALLLGGAAEAQQKYVFTPQWTPQAQFAGYYVAQELGFYKDAGIDLEIVHPNSTESAMSRLRQDKSHFTTIQLCQAMEIIDSGMPLVNILQTSMNNGLVIVSRNHLNPAQQKGIRVGTWSVGFDQIALAMSLKEDLNYQWIRFANTINLFLAGAIDATLAMSYNEYYLLKQSGVEVTEENTYRPQLQRAGRRRVHEAGLLRKEQGSGPAFCRGQQKRLDLLCRTSGRGPGDSHEVRDHVPRGHQPRHAEAAAG